MLYTHSTSEHPGSLRAKDPRFLHDMCCATTDAAGSSGRPFHFPMSGPVVCIIHQNVQSNANALSINKLVSAGCKLRFSANSVPDLIMSRSGTTAAFLLVVNSSDLHEESDTWNRWDSWCGGTQTCSTCWCSGPSLTILQLLLFNDKELQDCFIPGLRRSAKPLSTASCWLLQAHLIMLCKQLAGNC